MLSIEPILRALEFVEGNLGQEIAVGDVAEAAGYSLYHFCRTFSRYTHHSPYDYIMRRRLSESAKALLETERRIIDVAYDSGFNSPEVYSRAFRRMFGLQPRQWRRQGQFDRRLVMSRLTAAHIEQRCQESGLPPVVEELDGLSLVGVAALVGADQMEVDRLWAILDQELERPEGFERPWSYYGLSSYPQDWQRVGVLYMAAVETYPGVVGGSVLVTKTLSSGSFVCFQHQGTRSNLALTLDYAYHTWLPRSERRLGGHLEIERYGSDGPGAGSPGTEGLSVLIPVE